ncbi:MAG TPA: serine/threonine protein kinase [Burkholderiales bacterium]|nr:serine/threonine protein kinase [Burkholderiales bacterium]
MLFAIGYWTYGAVSDSLRELRAAALRNLLDSEVNAFRVWINEEIGDAERVARDPRAVQAVVELSALAARAGTTREGLCASPARARIEETLRPLLREVGDSTFNVIAPDGRLLATRYPEYCGLSVSRERFLPLLAPVFAGKPAFLRPIADEARIEAPERLRPGAPAAWMAVPVHGQNGVLAALAIAEPVDAVFASILGSARPGETGETFAFDANGMMLTAAEFGIVATIRSRIERLEGGGVILDPFESRRGAPVVGAWRWLPDYGMGVALQMEAAEAYAPLRYLSIAFSVVFGALVVAVIAALASLFSMMRLRSEAGGRKLGPYRLEKPVGEGGVATVYLARHDLLKRPTAVKLLKPARATDEMIARFEREVQLASSFSHPNTVEIFDYGRTRDGLFYYAMEYLDGHTIAEVVRRSGALPVARTIHVLRQVCAGLSEAHGKGLVHRDVKPENIMVCRYGGEHDFVKILDFGLVKSMGQPHSRDLTRSQRILGTPLYMAPERLRDPTDVDARADIYAVGAVAWLMLTGRRMFDIDEDFALTSKILNEEPPRVAAAAAQPVPVELDLLVTACLEKNREDRPQGVAGMIEALDALAAEHRWTQREAREWWAATSSAPPS